MNPRKYLKYTYISLIHIIRFVKNLFLHCRLYMLLFYYNVPQSGIKTGGGKVRIMLGRKSQLILGKNVNIANKWETGWYTNSIIRIKGAGKIIIGNNVGINSSGIFCDELIMIGDYTHIGGGTQIFDTDFHNLDFEHRRSPILNSVSKTSPVIIGSDVFVGSNCIITKGVTIGNRSIIAAGSVLTKSVPSDELWGGNPAKFIRKVKN